MAKDELHEFSFVASRNALVLNNQIWDDESVSLAGFDDIEPGDEAVIAGADSSDEDIRFALDAFGVTQHIGDITGDGSNNSIVRYRIERRVDKGGSWRPLPGLDTTYPYGEIGDPFQPYDSVIGPNHGFRIVFENRTDDFANEFTVSAREAAAQMNLVIIRGDVL